MSMIRRTLFSVRADPAAGAERDGRADRCRVPDACRREYLDRGWWSDDTLGGLVDRSLRAAPDATVRVWSETATVARARTPTSTPRRSGSSAALRAAGIEPGDVVAFQLPNSYEAIVAFYALAMGGYVLVPIVHIYGPQGGALHPGAVGRAGVHLGGRVRPRGLPRYRRRRRRRPPRCTRAARRDRRPPAGAASRAPARRVGDRRGDRRRRPPSSAPTPTTSVCSPTRRGRRASPRA